MIIQPHEIKLNEKIVLITFKNGDNPIFCRKTDFNVDFDKFLSTDATVFEITVDKVFDVQKTFKLVERDK